VPANDFALEVAAARGRGARRTQLLLGHFERGRELSGASVRRLAIQGSPHPFDHGEGGQMAAISVQTGPLQPADVGSFTGSFLERAEERRLRLIFSVAQGVHGAPDAFGIGTRALLGFAFARRPTERDQQDREKPPLQSAALGGGPI
jgi:hypothetical protein